MSLLKINQGNLKKKTP